MVNNVSRKITVEEAVKAGKQPCKICDPPPANPIPLTGTNKPRGSETTTYQCRGVTRKGTRCMHRTRIANGYCFQHNPDKTNSD
ncbi:MAG: hypothetical protein JNM68_01475 [Dinghuibacter sp.]|nr:hypothetical protein [Dinghuibacter sp.]